MGIFKRIKDMISSSINDMLEGNEDPEYRIDAIIREMEEAIYILRQETASSIADCKFAEKELSNDQEEINLLQKSAEEAVKNNRDDLAKEALRKKKILSDKIDVHQDQINRMNSTIDDLKAQLRNLEEKVQEARTKRETLLMKKRALEARKKAVESYNASHQIISNIDKLESLSSSIDKELLKAEAELQLYNHNTGSYDPFSTDIEDEIAKMKQKLKEENEGS